MDGWCYLFDGTRPGEDDGGIIEGYLELKDTRSGQNKQLTCGGDYDGSAESSSPIQTRRDGNKALRPFSLSLSHPKWANRVTSSGGIGWVRRNGW